MTITCTNKHQTVLPNPRARRQRWPEPDRFICHCKAGCKTYQFPLGTITLGGQHDNQQGPDS